jgi:cell fate regulator YaaT (PSP1 superfamily)
MIQYLVEINPWEKISASNLEELDLKIGSLVILNAEFGKELGRIIEMKEIKDEEKEQEQATIIALAESKDIQTAEEHNSLKNQALQDCKKLIKKYNLDMKPVDCHFSLDGQKLSFAFIANGRVDFRELVKELGRHFTKAIRLHQIGVRDEAKLIGDVGYCGLKQCCKTHLTKLGNVSSEFAEDQQIAHRGSERLSGTCGRLKCCLSYEENHYQELIKKLPPVGTRVKTEHGRGEVIGWHVLKCSVDVRIDPQKADDKPIIVEVPIKK